MPAETLCSLLQGIRFLAAGMKLRIILHRRSNLFDSPGFQPLVKECNIVHPKPTNQNNE